MTPSTHAAELAMLRTQRDALAKVVMFVWDNARDGYDTDVADVETTMRDAGLLDEGPATAEQAERFGVDEGDPILALSPFGRAALAGVRP